MMASIHSFFSPSVLLFVTFSLWLVMVSGLKVQDEAAAMGEHPGHAAG